LIAPRFARYDRRVDADIPPGVSLALGIAALLAPVGLVAVIVAYPVRALAAIGGLLIFLGAIFFVFAARSVIHEILAFLMILGGLGLAGMAGAIDVIGKGLADLPERIVTTLRRDARDNPSD